MSKGEETRQKMLDSAADLLQKQGYHGTGLKQILEESGTPRGSLYFHFPNGKEQLAAEAAADSGRQWREQLEGLASLAETPEDAMEVIIGALAAELESSDWTTGCPLATLALEMAPFSERIQQTCSTSYSAWEEVIAHFLEKFGFPEEERESLGLYVLSAIEGALLLARTHRSRRPLDAVKEQLVRHLELRRS